MTEYQLSETAPLALVVEDDEHAARIGSDMLRLLGYRSRIAKDAHEALYALAEGPPALILLDICLPEMDGVGLMRVMRRVQGMDAVPVVAASAVYPSEGPVARVLAEQGVTTYLSKPFMLEELRRAVDSARSSALKVGPAPDATMTDGRVRAVSDDDVAEASPAPPPVEASRPPEPEPEPVKTAPPPPPPPEPKPRPQPAPPKRPLGVDSAEFERPNPWASSASGEFNVPTASQVSTLSMDITGIGHTSAGPAQLVFSEISPSHAHVRSVDRPIAVGEMLRVEVGHRIPVDDAMTDVKIRMLLRVVDSEPFGRGSQLKAELSGAQPREHFDALVVWFSMR